ncbi:MAG: outer membrane beta-barrel protein [Bacteroidales bacterium]|nr:outer membrane beta-barrel protein [Bacteroidales bacterium]
MNKLLNVFSFRILLALLSLFPLFSFAQSESGFGKWSAGLRFAPEYAYRSLHATDGWNGMADYRDNMEIPSFGYTTGACILYKVNDKLSFESGLNFSDRHYSSTYRDIIFEVDEGIRKFKSSSHFYYLSLPVKGTYNVYSGKVKVYVAAAVYCDLFLVAKTVSFLKYDDGHVKKSSSRMDYDFSAFNMSGSLGAGIELPVNDRISIRFEPNYRRSFFPILDAPIREFEYSFGLDSGVIYHL